MIMYIGLISIITFFMGFLLGSQKPKSCKEKSRIKIETVADELKREYENFLSYDGTEQN